MLMVSHFIAPPVLTTTSQTIHAAQGDSVSLTCTSEGSPPDTFTWMKDGVQLQNNINTTSVTYTGSVAVFQSTYSISNISSSDIGNYTCTVSNPIGSDSLEIVLDNLFTTSKQVSMCLCIILVYVQKDTIIHSIDVNMAYSRNITLTNFSKVMHITFKFLRIS